MRITKVLLIWLLILCLAFLNGGLRELVLVPLLGLPCALMLSGLILSACVLATAIVTLPKLGHITRREALVIGFAWLLLTLAFEFGFGRLVQGRTWRELLEAYTFAHGNIWPVVLLVITFAPLLVMRIRV